MHDLIGKRARIQNADDEPDLVGVEGVIEAACEHGYYRLITDQARIIGALRRDQLDVLES